MRRAITISVTASISVVVASLVAMQLAGGSPSAAESVHLLVLMVWPSALFLLGSQAATPFSAGASGDPALLLAILVNVVLYAVLGVFLWAGTHRRGFLVVFGSCVALIWWAMWSV
jgi:hypothetical protein